MIVVDVNVVAYFFIEGDKTMLARDLMRKDPHWRLPSLWRHEFLDVLAAFVRHGGATIAEGKALWRKTIGLLTSHEQIVDMEAALILASENRISAYDGQYIALARQLQTVCVTEDKRLLRTFPDLTCAMRAYVAES